MYESEPTAKAARLMGVKALGPRKGGSEAEASGTRATAVITRVFPHLVGRKKREASFCLDHGAHVFQDDYPEFQSSFSTMRRGQAALATQRIRWSSAKQMNPLRNHRLAPVPRGSGGSQTLPNVARLSIAALFAQSEGHSSASRFQRRGKRSPLVADRGFEMAPSKVPGKSRPEHHSLC